MQPERPRKVGRSRDRWIAEVGKDTTRWWATALSQGGWRENGRRPKLSLSCSANDDDDDDTGSDYYDFRLKWMSIN